jgi:hypothetical protein
MCLELMVENTLARLLARFAALPRVKAHPTFNILKKCNPRRQQPPILTVSHTIHNNLRTAGQVLIDTSAAPSNTLHIHHG